MSEVFNSSCSTFPEGYIENQRSLKTERNQVREAQERLKERKKQLTLAEEVLSAPPHLAGLEFDVKNIEGMATLW